MKIFELMVLLGVKTDVKSSKIVGSEGMLVLVKTRSSIEGFGVEGAGEEGAGGALALLAFLAASAKDALVCLEEVGDGT